MREICSECGRSVAPGSGLFEGRVPDSDPLEERAAMGKPYAEGDFVCRECKEPAVRVEGESAILNPRQMKENFSYIAELGGKTYLYRRVGEEIEVYELVGSDIGREGREI